MKTAEEILTETLTVQSDSFGRYYEKDVLKAMKTYANQKLDEAEKNAKVIHVEQDGDPISAPIDQLSVFQIKHYEVPTYVIVDCNSISNLKDEL